MSFPSCLLVQLSPSLRHLHLDLSDSKADANVGLSVRHTFSIPNHEIQSRAHQLEA